MGPLFWLPTRGRGSEVRTSGLPTPPIPIGAGGAWYRSTETGGVSSGSLALWPDISGNGNNATQATMASQPTVTPGQINGLPGVVFDGVDDGMLTALNLLSPYTVFMVAKSNQGAAYVRFIQASDNNRIIVFNRDSNSVYLGAAVANDTTVFPGGNWGIGCLAEGADSAWFVNGVNKTDLTSVGNVDWGTVVLNGVGLAPEYASCSISEILIVPYAATDTQRQTVQNYMFARYAGLTDPDAQNFVQAQIAAGVSLTLAQMQAVNNRVVAAKAGTGYWEKLQRYYPFLGISATSDAMDLVTTLSGTFSGTVTHAANGVTGDGASGFFDTGLSPFSNSIFSNNLAFGCYLRTEGNENNSIIIAFDVANASLQAHFEPDFESGQYFYATNCNTGGGFFDAYTTPPFAFGLFCDSRISATSHIFYQGSTALATDTGAQLGLPSLTFQALGDQYTSSFSTANMASLFISYGLTQADMTQFEADEQAFQTALSRAV
jgi:hypothetical protein